MATKPKGKVLEERLQPTRIKHVFNFDTTGDGSSREIAVVKMLKNTEGKIAELRYVDVALLDTVDKGRLKGIVLGRHSDKYELWDLMAQTMLSNGKNALDYFHQMVRIERGAGAVNTSLGGGLADVRIENNTMIGADFSDPSSGSMDTQVAN
jgi:hypothetical protein